MTRPMAIQTANRIQVSVGRLSISHRQASAETIRAAAEHAADGTTPTSDGNADADYREHLARVLTGRAVAAAAGVGGERA